jgi:organic radical activating enzyme
MSISVTKLTTGGIMTTYECSVQCAHCRHKASPTRNGGFISFEMLDKIIIKLEQLGCSSVHLEGGEPFLYPNELVTVVKRIKQSSIHLEHIVTNCSWHKNQKETKDLLKKLKTYGLGRLLLKVSPFQNENIPLKKAHDVAKIAKQLGINAMIWDNEVYPEVSSFDASKTHSLKKYLKKYGNDYMKKLAGCFNVTFAGRSFEVFGKYLNTYTVAELFMHNKGCSYDFPTSTHFHVDMHGNFIFSHTNGVTVHIDDIGNTIDPKKYPYLTILYAEGVSSLYKLAVGQYGFKAKVDGYMSKCHLCYEVRKFLVVQKGIDSPDLQPLDFYFEN